MDVIFIDHAFEKPNDERGLNLMNICAVSRLGHFPDIVFAHGVSDEYSALQHSRPGTLSKDKNELLFQQFGVNYDKLPAIFRKGSCVYMDKLEETMKLDEGGNPVKRLRKKVTVTHVDIIGPKFWNEHPYILEEGK
ncbi:putative tRNA(His) guanylyltransferase [Dioscorea sansibarensis]